jgi:ATP-dependent helicase/nuclease subunit A
MREPVDQRQRTLAQTDLKTTYLVEAGAGTGKTRILVERFVNCLRRGTPLPSVAAITFTEKAAGDLRQRLTSRLEQYLAGAAGELAGDEREHLSRALSTIDTAVVSTIHSFAGRLLRERPVEAGVDPAFGQLDDLGSELLLARLWRDWLESIVDESPAAPGATELGAALEAGVNLGAVQKVAFAHFGRRHAVRAREPVTSPDLTADVRRLQTWVAPLKAAAAQCVDQGDTLCAGMLALAAVLGSLDGRRDATDVGWALVGIDQRRSSFGKKGAGNKANWPGGKDDPLLARDSALDSIEAAAARFLEFVAALTAGAARGFVAFAQEEQRAAGVLDFDDLLGRARDLLAGHDMPARDARLVRAYFQQKYRYLLVDEFQDTDPLQVEIVLLLAAANPADDDWRTLTLKPGKLFLVGDPKQSIYRFRDADIAIFHEVKQRICEQGKVFPIEQNFRTLPGIVGWVNTAFAQIIGDVDEDLRPKYLPITAWRNDPTRDLKVCVLRPQQLSDSEKTGEVREAEARALAGLLAGLDQLAWVVRDPEAKDDPPRPARLGDVTILFRTFTAIEIYERALREARVPYRVEGGRSYFQRPEIVDVLAGLRALDVPGDELAVYAALHGSLFGFSDDELYAFYAAGGRFDLFAPAVAGFGEVAEGLTLLRELHEARTTRSIAHVVDELIRRTRLHEVLAADGGGPQAGGNLEKLVQLADAFSAEEGATFHAYVRKLAELQARADEGESPVGESGQFVRLMSIHKAKGLEFPVVVLADVGGQPRAVAYDDVLIGSAGRRLMFGIAVDPPEGVAKTARCHLAGDSAVRLREADARSFEARRLLYVAATRAMDRLVIPVVSTTDPVKGSFLEQLHPFLLIDEHSPAEGVALLKAAGSTVAPAPPPVLPPNDLLERRAAWLEQRTKALAAARRPAPITSPSRLELLDRPDAAAGAPPSNEQALVLGHLVHEIMERVPLDDQSALTAIADEAAREVGRSDLAVHAAALAAACWRSAPVRAAAAGRHWRELPVSAAIGDILIEGYVDLVFDAGDGFVIVDFKTDRDADVSAAARRYELQLGAYAVALEEATGRHVAETWVVMAAGGEESGIAPAARIPVDEALRDRVRAAARDAAIAGRPLVETLSR